MQGDKVLVLDDQLIGPLGLIAPSNLLKSHGVKKIYKLNNKPFDVPKELRNILYIVRPRMHLMKWIALQVKHFNAKEETDGHKNVSVFLVPRRTLICEKVLEELGVLGDLKTRTLGEYPLDLIPFDTDVLSMEISSSFRECHLVTNCIMIFNTKKFIGW